MKTFAILLAAPLFLEVAAAQGVWTQQSPTTSPSARNRQELVTQLNGTVLLFGGRTGTGGALSDTWRWDGANWANMAPANSPGGRMGHGMALDQSSGRTVVFSGWSGGSYLADTWVFASGNWVNVNPANLPPGRDWPAMAWDENSQSVLLYGGHDWSLIVSGTGAFDDTWSWSGANWNQLGPANSPGRRQGHRMIYDPNSGLTITLGGGSGTGVTYNDMWGFDGSTWTQLTPPNLPSPRSFFGLTWDEARQRVVLHGGSGGGAVLSDTWEWDGLDWTQTATGGPGRHFLGMTYDGVNDRTLLQGGAIDNPVTADSDETWSYEGPSADWTNHGNALAGVGGEPVLTGQGALSSFSTVTLQLSNAAPSSTATLIVGGAKVDLPLFGGLLVPSPNFLIQVPIGANGGFILPTVLPGGVPVGVSVFLQAWIVDATGPQGYAASNGLEGLTS